RTLRLSVALQEIWGTSVTAEALRHEVERIAAQTRLPERLEEIYDALGRDPLLVQECLARPALAERLARRFFASHPRIHSAARAAIEATRRGLMDGSIDPLTERPDRRVDGRSPVRAMPAAIRPAVSDVRDHGDSYDVAADLFDVEENAIRVV